MSEAGGGRTLYFVGPWDLNRQFGCIPERPEQGPVLLVTSERKGSALPYHRKKLVLVLSAMRHFAAELRAEGFEVLEIAAEGYIEGIRQGVDQTGARRIKALEPREWGMDRALRGADFGDAELDLLPDGGDAAPFLLTRDEFLDWAGDRKQLRMDTFYRWMRRRSGLLMKRGKPDGGRWSFDAENRKPPGEMRPPAARRFEPDESTRRVMEQVAARPGHWGSVNDFDWPVTRTQALEALTEWLDARAARFGDFQDAMLRGEPYLWHSLVSSSINLGLLTPGEVCAAVLERYQDGALPLNTAEGFIRQVIGWREFIRGVYHLRMPELRSANLLGADRPLPAVYWDPDRTDMACLSDSLRSVLDTGYAHHIQRLMVLGNYALLAGIDPVDVHRWFWAGFVDAFEWVELPNVVGMALFADDGFTTKPYAASGAYINRMSDYCGGCRYRVKERSGPEACPFNPLFWRFMAKHRERFEANPRLKVLYRSWDRWSDEQRADILAGAEAHLATLEPADHGWSFDEDQC